MKYFLLTCILHVTVLLYPGKSIHAQSKVDEEYRKESDDIRKEVWGWSRPEFKNRNIPAAYANVSKVVIAHRTDLSTDRKSAKKFSVMEIVREMIKLNDKSSVEEYSQLSFTRLQQKSGFYRTKSTTFIGVRVIKPDQTIKEINADDIILTKDDTKEKNAKLAIPNLQPGDIIDYFFATEQVIIHDYSAKDYTVFLFDDAPMLHYSFHAELDKKFAVDYRSYNGAPELQVSKDNEDDIIIDVEKENIAPFETSLWVAPALQLPLIRMYIARGYNGPWSKIFGATKPGLVNRNINTDRVVESKADTLTQNFLYSYAYQRYVYKEMISEAKDMARESGLSFNKMSDEEKAAFLYYYLRFTKVLDFNIDELKRSINSGEYIFNGLSLLLYNTFKEADLEPAFLISTPRTGYRMNEVIDEDDMVAITYLMGTDKFFSIGSIYDFPFTVPELLDGVKNTSSIKVKGKSSSAHGSSEVGPGQKIRVSAASENAHIEQLAISVNTDQNKLTIQRKTVAKGYYKYELQKRLILYEDYYDLERKVFGQKKSLIETLEDKKKSRKYVDEVKSAFAEARGKQKAAFTDEAKEWFDQDITNITNYRVDNMGVRHTAPDLVYSSSFNLEGIVKKAGNNLILEIGKIQGQPMSIRPDQQKRTMDVYMPFARSIEYEINLKIPDGYSAEGVETLNKKTETEAGFFTAEATTSGQVITIKVKKHYLHNYEPVANWDKLKEFIDAANDWTNSKILLRKK